ncbi:MAG TPA: PIG-L family deacetylase [Candidatus Acidoferrales bacterium]|nr:PIG-L family deacetylase [Candidatus Acidoferrales bacterium]
MFGFSNRAPSSGSGKMPAQSREFSRASALVLGTLAALLLAPALTPPRASLLAAQSLPDTVVAIDKARVTTRILFITAHPDDEWASLLTYLSRGLNADVGLLTITRGQGGQNAIGPEQGSELGMIRTEELLAAGKHYGVRQFFTRAMDTGFVKTPEQAQKIWGGLALEDMVRVIRTFRPQVVINGWGGVHSGHGHHQESGILTPQAVAAAADPKMFPEQLAEGLPAWKVPLDLRSARDNIPGSVEMPIQDVSPLWGKSYVDMGMEGHAQHRSQGTPSFFGNPFFRRPVYLVRENEKGDPAGSFDAKLLAEPLSSLAERFPAYQEMLEQVLRLTDRNLQAARHTVLALHRLTAAMMLAHAATEIAKLQDQAAKQGGEASAALIWELGREREKIDAALSEDIALPVVVAADRRELVAAESFSVDVNFLGKPAVPVKWTLDASSLLVPHGWNVKIEKPGADKYKFSVEIPPGATPPDTPGDVILPYPPPLVRIAPKIEIEGYSFADVRTVESMKATTTGIDTYSLELVPAVTLTPDPQQVMVPAERASQPVTLLARVRYHGTKPAKVSVGLDAPKAWQVQPIAPLDFSSAGDQLIRYSVAPPANIAPGAYPLRPYAELNGRKFSTSLEPIPTLPTHDWSEPADATVHVMNLAVPAHLRVGYIAASNDPIPDTLRQIGIQVDMLDEIALAFEDLRRYDSIVVGIRAYDLRPDLLRSNRRLLDYVQQGGSLVVQYQRDPQWISAMPYPATMPDQTSRVTDANSPVRFLAPDNPVVNSPNKITLADFEGWEQERGLYFLGSFDSHYIPVLGLKDPGEAEANGALVYARDGKGVYIYTGLSFFRELPAGVPGAYRLFVNLLSQTQHASGHD